jgi:hypothetical protein
MNRQRVLKIATWTFVAAVIVGIFTLISVLTAGLFPLIFGGIALAVVAPMVALATANLTTPSIPGVSSGIWVQACNAVRNHPVLVGGTILGGLVRLFISKDTGNGIIAGSLVYDIYQNCNGILLGVIAVVALVLFLSAVGFIPCATIGLILALVCMVPSSLLGANAF